MALAGLHLYRLIGPRIGHLAVGRLLDLGAHVARSRLQQRVRGHLRAPAGVEPDALAQGSSGWSGAWRWACPGSQAA